MNYLVTLYCPDTDEYCYHTLFGVEGEALAMSENLARLLGYATGLFWDVHETSMIDNTYPLKARSK